MPIYRVLLTSKESIHGVRLRELVKEIALKAKPTITGQVQNEKDEHEVGIICKVEDDAQCDKFLADIKEAAEEKKILVENQPPVDASQLAQWMELDTFEVIKSDPLHEIDLSIRGAERLFYGLQRDLLSFLKEREKQKLTGIDNGFKDILFCLKNPEAKYKVHLEALQNFLITPFDESLFKTCRDMNQLFDELTEYEGKKVADISPERRKQLVDLLETALKRTTELLDRK